MDLVYNQADIRDVAQILGKHLPGSDDVAGWQDDANNAFESLCGRHTQAKALRIFATIVQDMERDVDVG